MRGAGRRTPPPGTGLRNPRRGRHGRGRLVAGGSPSPPRRPGAAAERPRRGLRRPLPDRLSRRGPDSRSPEADRIGGPRRGLPRVPRGYGDGRCGGSSVPPA
ncbi:MAG TPA: hypothetical protein DER07_08160, partial [Armatimonadetes bacterium]|nr:hypothetical protein [Armatimonadota bacterium]